MSESTRRPETVAAVPEGKRRFGRVVKLSLWILPCLLFLYLVLHLANFVWFRTHIPTAFYDANWIGEWETDYYWGMSGKLLVRLPDPIPEDEDFDAEALVYYPVYSVWKTGQFVKMNFGGHFSPESSSSSGDTTVPPGYTAVSYNGKIPHKGGRLTFKATAGRQTVEYVALMDESGTRIVGAYFSRSPNDYGHIWLKYY